MYYHLISTDAFPILVPKKSFPGRVCVRGGSAHTNEQQVGSGLRPLVNPEEGMGPIK